MPQAHFTDAKVRLLKSPKGRPQIDYFESLPPGRSLILTVGASRRTWSVLFYVRSKPKRRKLGYVGYADADYPSLTCKQAREGASLRRDGRHEAEGRLVSASGRELV